MKQKSKPTIITKNRFRYMVGLTPFLSPYYTNKAIEISDNIISQYFIGVLSALFLSYVITTIIHIFVVDYINDSSISSPATDEKVEVGNTGGTYPLEGVGVTAPPTEFNILDYPKKFRGKIKAYRTAYKACIDNNVDLSTDFRTLPDGKSRNRLVNLYNMTNTVKSIDINPNELTIGLV